MAFISASVASSKYIASQVTIFLFVSMISFWISLFIVGFYLFKFDEKFDKISFNTFVSFIDLFCLVFKFGSFNLIRFFQFILKQGLYYSCLAGIAYFGSSIMTIFLGGFLGAACVSLYDQLLILIRIND